MTPAIFPTSNYALAAIQDYYKQEDPSFVPHHPADLNTPYLATPLVPVAKKMADALTIAQELYGSANSSLNDIITDALTEYDTVTK